MSTESDTDNELEFEDSLVAADVDTSEDEPTSVQEPATDPTPDSADVDESIPEKFRGKSPAEIAAMYQQLETAYGRQGNELGDVRKILDDVLVKTVNAPAEAPTSAPEPEIDFFDDPQSAASAVARRELENNPLLKELKEEVTISKQERAARELTSQHPDFKVITGSEPFQRWLADDPETQAELLTANQNFDSKTACRILRQYKQTVTYHQWKQAQQPAEGTDTGSGSPGEAVRRASTGSGKTGGGKSQEKFLSRAALVELRRSDPAKYRALAPKIRRMYELGRVK